MVKEAPRKIFRGIYALVVGFSETMTLSLYKNIKRHYRGKSNKYRELKVPGDYKDTKQEPEYRDLTSQTPKKENNDFDFRGLPGF